MKKLFLLLFLPLIVFSCSKNDDNPVHDNQYLISTQKESEITKIILSSALLLGGFSDYASLPQTDVTLLRTSYKTVYPKTLNREASGVFIIPKNVNINCPVVVYAHGTIYQNEAPSLKAKAPLMQPIAMDLIFAMTISSSFNCVVLVPDYIGYGSTAAIDHPYTHKESLAQASFDFILAYKEYTKNINSTFNNNIFVTGYSEGGYAAVALQEKIQENDGAGLQVVKTVAGSGPYDNVALAKTIVGQTVETSAHFLSSYLWAIQMYKIDYNYSKSYNDIFSAEDNVLLQDINYKMAYFASEDLAIHTNSAELFHPSFVAGVLNETDTEFLQALKDNSLVEFAPQDSLIFVYGGADTWVSPENTENAYNAMVAKQCKVKKYKDPTGDHYTTLDLYLKVLIGSLRGF